MSLWVVAGPSGSGKSTYVYEEMIREAIAHPDRQFILVVPDQYSMSATRRICSLHPRQGILNIDVLSFSRLIHRIGDEVGRKMHAVLDDTGKNLILRRVAMEHEEELGFLKGRMKRPGYIHEVKSQISEFYQYDIAPGDLDEMIEESSMQGYLSGKLKDLKVLYEAFQGYIRDKYITTEEALSELAGLIPRSDILAGSVVLFDHFTGFTPVQEKVISALLKTADKVVVTLALEQDEDGKTDRLFELTGKTCTRLLALAKEAGCVTEPTLFMSDPSRRRYNGNPPMDFLEKHLLRPDESVFAGEQDAIRILEATSRRSEVQNCCLRIRELIRRGYEYRQIAIETQELEGYADLLEAELNRYGIPFYTDRPRSVMQNRAVIFLRYALKILAGDFSRDSVMGFLRSSMTDLTEDEIDRFELYLAAMGIRGKSRYLSCFEKGKNCEEAEEIRLRLAELLSPLLQPMKTAREFCRGLYELCTESRLQDKCLKRSDEYGKSGDVSAAKEYEKIYESLMGLLDQIYELIGDDEMDCAQFLAIFEAGVAELRIGTIPQAVDQVMVGDMTRTRLESVKALFFLGVNDGIIPARNNGGGLLSDMEREFLLSRGVNMAPGPRQKLYEQRLYLYQNMTKPSERLYLSYSLLDSGGGSMQPSYLIRHLLSLYPALKVESDAGSIGELSAVASGEDGLDDLAFALRSFMDAEEAGEQERIYRDLRSLSAAYGGDERAQQIRRAALWKYVPMPLSREAVAAIHDDRATISRLELMAACPYAHFLRYELAIREKEEYLFEQSDMGTVYHRILEQVLAQLREDGRKLWELEDEEITAVVREYMASVADQYGNDVMHATKRNTYRGVQMERVLGRCLRNIGYHLKKGEFTPALFEHRFERSGEYPIRGIIDRIDVADRDGKLYVKVVDYKSGETQLDESKLYYGVSLQLPIYLARAAELMERKNPGREVIPAAMFYYLLKDPLIKDKADRIEEEIRKEMRVNGLFLEEDQVLRLLDSDLAGGGSSDVIRASVNKDGNLSSNSQSVSREEMKEYLDFAEQKVGQLMERIGQGDISIRPISIGGDSFDSCTYCSYRGICRFDERIDGFCKTAHDKRKLKEDPS
ncbi:MAG: PD-(D/E)XK nuclease family protein [Lachnospiraceae bacterium]|nr:PD-(D/E)XK nuclease family protein [Lachnospiraceae bacterium]